MAEGMSMGVTRPGWHSSGEPLYKWIKRELTQLLGNGVWRPAQAIPSERRLAEEFGVSMGTMRRALDELVAEHILIRHQGRGTFVSAHDTNRFLFRFFNIAAHDGERSYPKVNLLDFGPRRADATIARALSIRPAARVYGFRNLLSLQGEPALVDEIYLPAVRFAGLDEDSLRHRTGTLYQLYEERFGNSVTHIDERVRAMVADPFLAGVLQVEEGAPLLHIIRRALSVDGRPVEYRHSYVSTERHEYSRSFEESEPGR